jgi:lysophospholipase
MLLRKIQESPASSLACLFILVTRLTTAEAAQTIAESAPATGERFTFRSSDGIRDLSAVCFPVSHPKEVIVMVNGRSESWLKYAPLCRELNRSGYTVYSYDHRGQGLSPRLTKGNPQIGHVDDFSSYSRDLDLLLKEVRRREGSGGISLLGNSMGAAVIVDFLSEHPDACVDKVVLCSPMFRIRTAPWPEPVARAFLGGLHLLGKGATYAPGESDASPTEPFEHNRITSSRKRWEEILLFRKNHPEAVTGGASVDWVIRVLDSTPRIRRAAGCLGPETLILEAGRDAFVIPFHPPATTADPGPWIIGFPEGRHELLMESEPIRRKVLNSILSFLGSPVRAHAIPLDRSNANGHTSVKTPFIP